MAVVDLRNVSIFLRDGTSLARTGRVNFGAGYATTTTTMVVDGVTGIIGTGQSFILDGEIDVYRVTAHSETSGNTTSITFTPGLVTAVVDNDTFTLVAAVNHSGGYPLETATMVVDGFAGEVDEGSGFTINGGAQLYTILDHSETSSKTTSITFAPGLVTAVLDNAYIEMVGNLIEMKIGEGTLTYSEKRGVVYVLNRGKISTVKLGDDAPVDVSAQFIWEFLRAGTGEPPTPEEALKKIGAASEWVTSGIDACEPYCVDIILCNVPPCEGSNEVIILKYFRWEDLSHDLKAGQITVTGKSNIAFADVSHTG